MATERFGDRILKLRQDNNMTQEDVANEINRRNNNEKLSKSLISRYEHNIHKPKDFSIVRDMADLFSVSTDYLMCRSNDMYTKHNDVPSMKKIPILGTIAAGIPILAQEDIEDYTFIPESEGIDFCLRVKGDSMIGARILDGDLVYIHKQATIENGEIAAVLVDNEAATLKRVYTLNGTIVLRAENPNYKDMIFTKKDFRQVNILGKAVFLKSAIR